MEREIYVWLEDYTKIQINKPNVYKIQKSNERNKMKEKRGLREILTSKSAIGIVIFIVVSLAFAFAGNIVVKEGNMDVNGSLTAGSTNLGVLAANGANGTSGVDAPDVLTVTGGTGYSPGLVDVATKGSDIFLRAGDGGNGDISGNGGDIELTPGIGGTMGASGSNGNIILAKNGGNVKIKKDNSKLYFGAGDNVSIYFDGINLKFDYGANASKNIAYFTGNVSALGYFTRTSVYDKSKGSALDFIRDAEDYKTNGEIDHTKFYGYTTYQVTDLSNSEDAKTEGAVSLNAEIDVLRQAVFELKQQNTLLKSELCLKDKAYLWCV
jgi:hypothetical protein